MTTVCTCREPDCAESVCWHRWATTMDLSKRPDDELLRFIDGAKKNGLMDCPLHMHWRVYVLIELMWRSMPGGNYIDFAQVPYLVWTLVMGPDIPPPHTPHVGMWRWNHSPHFLHVPPKQRQ